MKERVVNLSEVLVSPGQPSRSTTCSDYNPPLPPAPPHIHIRSRAKIAKSILRLVGLVPPRGWVFALPPQITHDQPSQTQFSQQSPPPRESSLNSPSEGALSPSGLLRNSAQPHAKREAENPGKNFWVAVAVAGHIGRVAEKWLHLSWWSQKRGGGVHTKDPPPPPLLTPTWTSSFYFSLYLK